MNALRTSPVTIRTLPEVISLMPQGMEWARGAREALCLSSVVLSEPGLVLGALQPAARARAWLAAQPEEGRPLGSSVTRRFSTGNYVRGQAVLVHHALILPSLNWLSPDATRENFINRSIRGLLRGYSSLGLLAHYFGRDTFTFLKRPAGQLGIDQRGGVWLLEAWVGWGEPAPCFAERGYSPIGLREALSSLAEPASRIILDDINDSGAQARAQLAALAAAQRVHERWLTQLPAASSSPLVPLAEPVWELPQELPELNWLERPVPIGALYVARSGPRFNIRGDILTSVEACARLEHQLSELAPERWGEAFEGFAESPLFGARFDDIYQACLALHPDAPRSNTQ